MGSDLVKIDVEIGGHFRHRPPIVQVRTSWSGEWQTVPYLRPIKGEWNVAPAISTAVFEWLYGTISQEGTTRGIYKPYPLGLVGCYVRIASLPDDPDETDLLSRWVGVIADEGCEPAKGGPAQPTGQQTLVARGLESLLTRCEIDGSYCLIGATVQKVGEVLPFNLRSKAGNSILGNRSTAKHGGTYVFSSDGAVWTAGQVAEYLLGRFGPEKPAFTLAGELVNLAYIKNVWPPKARLWAALGAVIDRRRGHGFRVACLTSVDDEPDPVYLSVFSVFDERVSAGDVQLTPNPSTVSIDLEGEAAGIPMIRRSVEHRFDRIVVRGEPVIVCGTLAFADSTLVKAWTAATETAYKSATDRQREQYRYRQVYRSYRVPVGWNFQAGNGAGGAQHNGSPTVTANGTLDASAAAPAWPYHKTLLRELPLRPGRSYAGAAETVTDASAPEGFMRARVWIKARLTDGTLAYIPIDRLGKFIKGAPSMPVAIVEGEMGLRVGANPNHLLADNHWSGAAASQWSAALDYEKIVATVAWAPGSRLAVEVTIPRSITSDERKTLTIDVPHACCWVLLPGTVLEYTGTVATRAVGMTIRNDRDKLAVVAAVAKAWYARNRRAISVNFSVLTFAFTPGTILAKMRSVQDSFTVATPITRIAWNWVQARTTIQTDYGELDFIGVSGANALGSSSIEAPALTAPERDRLAAIPLRPAEPGKMPTTEFWAKITASEAADDPARNRWKYSFVEIVPPATAGYGTWSTVTDGYATGEEGPYAFNTIENMNVAADAESPTVMGNGVDIDGADYPAGFAPQPAPDDAIVRISRIVVGEAEQFWFAYENADDGTCEAE